MLKSDEFVKISTNVIPAKAGIYKFLKRLDSRLRGNDDRRIYSEFNIIDEPIKKLGVLFVIPEPRIKCGAGFYS